VKPKVKDKTSIRDFLNIVFKQRIPMLIFFSATVCTVVIGTLSAKPKYEATSQILLSVGGENFYMPEMPLNGDSSAVVRYDREEQINSEISILTSPSLAESVVESLGATKIYESLDGSAEQDSITEIAVLKVQKALRVKGIENSNVIEVSFKHTNQRMAAKVVNELISLFLERHLDVQKHPQSYPLFQDLSQVLRKELEQTEEAQTFKRLHNISALNEQRSYLAKQMAALCNELDQALSQEAETTKRIAQLGQRLTGIPKNTQQNVSNQGPQKDLFRYQGELKTLKSRRDTLTVQLDDYQGKLEELNQVEVELNQLQNEIEVDRQNFPLYLSKFEGSRIYDAIDAEKITYITQTQSARPPLKPVSPKVKLNILLAFFLGGFGALGLGFFLEYLDDRLERPNDTEHLLRLPVLASIPELRSCSPGSSQERIAPHSSLSPWFAFGISVLVIVFILLNVGHYLRDSQLEAKGDESHMGRNVVHAKIIRQLNDVKNPKTELFPLRFAHDPTGEKVALASVPGQDHAKEKRNVQEFSGEQNHGPMKASINESELQSGETTNELNPSTEKKGREVLNGMATLSELSPEKAKRGGITIQVGAFRERSRAEDLVRMLQEKGYDSYVAMKTRESLKPLYLVRIGGIKTGDEGRMVTADLVRLGFNDCYVMRLAQNQ
jgi:uncharacterized protein involved in exopolysaccharide biosynthesis